VDVQQLRDARRAAGLSQAEVARRLGTTQSAIARWERGDVSPSLANAVRYAEAVRATLTLTTDQDLLEPEDRATLQANLRRTPEQRLAQLTGFVRFAMAGRRAMAEARARA
jgi:transcriptional regulator with XRE-family HTH domain